MSINKVILIGNCCKDPEIRTTQDGKEIASFSLATNESWKDKSSGEKKEKVEFHRVVVFSSGLANIVKNYVKKGSKLYIEGQLQTRKWTDKDGVEKYTTEIVLQGFNSVIQLLGGKSLQDAGIDKALDAVDNSKANSNQEEEDGFNPDCPF
jgi:single-strand DNA-binding protein